MKILVVEDEKGLAESITDYLSREGFICEVANTFWQADEKDQLVSIRLYYCRPYPARRRWF
jgi:DNA-binding response OmpR family regulator